MSSLVNIAVASRAHEAGYRYKREVISVNHEHFKGVVTRITNLATIAKQLQTSLPDLELALVKQVKKTLGISTCGPLTFPGKRLARDFDQVLQVMIEKFILCPKCQLPEWNKTSCAACGHQARTLAEPSVTDCQLPEETDDPQWIRDLNQTMHNLYQRRAHQRDLHEPTASLDALLDLCWSLESEKDWKKHCSSLLKQVE